MLEHLGVSMGKLTNFPLWQEIIYLFILLVIRQTALLSWVECQLAMVQTCRSLFFLAVCSRSFFCALLSGPLTKMTTKICLDCSPVPYCWIWDCRQNSAMSHACHMGHVIYHMAITCVSHGAHVIKPCDTHVIHKDHMRVTWMSHGCRMDVTWGSHGGHMDVTWGSHGGHMCTHT